MYSKAGYTSSARPPPNTLRRRTQQQQQQQLQTHRCRGTCKIFPFLGKGEEPEEKETAAAAMAATTRGELTGLGSAQECHASSLTTSARPAQLSSGGFARSLARLAAASAAAAAGNSRKVSQDFCCGRAGDRGEPGSW